MKGEVQLLWIVLNIQKNVLILENDQFVKSIDNPTKPTESKIQRCVRKLKSKITKD